jgi:transposase-like protein
MEAEVGMLVVETIAKIRRAYFVDGRPIKAICRELGVSRKVVRNVIRAQATEFRYERETQPQPKMGLWSAELDRLLEANESKATRERLTLIRLFEELRGLGYVGGLRCGSSVCAALEPRAWRLFGLCAAELCTRRSLPV